MWSLVRHRGARTQQIWLVLHYWNRLLRWIDCIHHCSYSDSFRHLLHLCHCIPLARYIQLHSAQYVRSRQRGSPSLFATCSVLKHNDTVTASGTAALAQWKSSWLYPAGAALVVAVLFLLLFNSKPSAHAVHQHDAAFERR